MIARFWSDRRGATVIEYAMIAAFVSIVIVTAVTSIGTKLNDSFVAVGAGFK